MLRKRGAPFFESCRRLNWTQDPSVSFTVSSRDTEKPQPKKRAFPAPKTIRKTPIFTCHHQPTTPYISLPPTGQHRSLACVSHIRIIKPLHIYHVRCVWRGDLAHREDENQDSDQKETRFILGVAAKLPVLGLGWPTIECPQMSVFIPKHTRMWVYKKWGWGDGR